MVELLQEGGVMGWDNRIININGRGLEMLEMALTIACDEGCRENACGKKLIYSRSIIGSIVDPKCGLIWLQYKREGAAIYPAPITPRQAAEISMTWLDTQDSKLMPCDGWDADADHDGDNTRGWRVYCEDWGHVGAVTNAAICAVRPVFLWHGK